ncbi:MAG TPA: hypothetical protein VGS07_04220 [Thermoanaerobaculia bacterium]|nr:hypothetical protein [Thermoanaerobaculia bacterium]
MSIQKLLVYLWAGPTTLLGLIVAGLTALSKGRCEVREGILAVSGGFARRFLSSRLLRANAMALGHVVMARDRVVLERCWAHERQHVRQAEKWGVAFIPAYLLASAWAFLSGCHYYYDNWFEKDADRKSGR